MQLLALLFFEKYGVDSLIGRTSILDIEGQVQILKTPKKEKRGVNMSFDLNKIFSWKFGKCLSDKECLDHVQEEAGELKEARELGDDKRINDELMDCLQSCVSSLVSRIKAKKLKSCEVRKWIKKRKRREKKYNVSN